MVGESSVEQIRATCAAPRSALYFRPDGAVTACCASWHVLGRVTGPQRRTLREIWESDEATLLRRALDAGDYGYGCWECGAMVREGRREASLEASFDPFERPRQARFPSVMDFALSNRCNLQCVMCNGGLSSAIRSQREGRPPLAAAYDDRFFDELTEFLPHLERASFKGGEPFLARENWRVWDQMNDLAVDTEIAVTTNGTIWNERVARLLQERRASVNVSIDALDPDLLREIRVGVDPAQLHANLDRFQAATEATGAGLTLSFCLMAQNWWELPSFLVESARRGAHPNVIWVDGPERFGLLKLPPHELAGAADALDRAADASTELTEAGRATVHQAAQRMREARSAQRTATSTRVDLRRGTAGVAGYGAAVAVAVAELEADAGVAATVLTYRDSVVAHIEAAPWSDELGRIEWVGSGLDEFTTRLASGVGCPMRGEIEPMTDGHYGLRLVLEHPSAPMTIVGRLVPGAVGEATIAFVRTMGATPGTTSSAYAGSPCCPANPTLAEPN